MMKDEITNKLAILISIAIAIISSYGQTKDQETGVILFLGLLIMIIIYFLISYPLHFLKEKLNQTDENTRTIKKVKEDLNSLKEQINYNKQLENLKIKCAVMENMMLKNKRGIIIDPRWVVIIIMLILFFLYMRAKGWI